MRRTYARVPVSAVVAMLAVLLAPATSHARACTDLNPPPVFGSVIVDGLGARTLGGGGGAAACTMASGKVDGFSHILVGYSSMGTLTQTGGTIGLPGSQVILGFLGGSDGLYDLSGGVLGITTLSVGLEGTGLFDQTGGSVGLAGNLGLRIGRLNSAEYRLQNGSLSVNGIADIGEEAQGTLVQSGGDFNAAFLNLGLQASGDGSYMLQGGTSSQMLLRIGHVGQGVVEATAGRHDVESLIVGDGFTDTDGTVFRGTGIYNLSGIAELSAASLDPSKGDEVIGRFGHGTFNQHGGTNTVQKDLIVGQLAGSIGSYVQDGGTTIVTDNRSIGVHNALVLGEQAGSAGSYDLSGLFSELSAGRAIIGGAGIGTLTQSGGTNSTALITIGDAASGDGHYIQDGGDLFSQVETIGFRGTGAFTQRGGLNDIGSNLFMAAQPGSTGTYELIDGTLSVGDLESIGFEDRGHFTQSGGLHEAGNSVFDVVTLGDRVGGHGIYDQDGGDFHIAGDLVVGRFGIGEFNLTDVGLTVPILTIGDDLSIGKLGDGEGFFTQSGGTVDVNDTLYLGDDSRQSRGEYTLNLGRLNTFDEQIGDEGFGKFLQSSGTHDVTNDVMLGQEGFGMGEYHLSGGIFDIGGTLYLGDDSPDTEGLFVMTGGELHTADEQIGDEGFGKFLQSSGLHQAVNNVMIGQQDFGEGEYHLSGDAVFEIGGTLYLGDDSPDTKGLFMMTGGELHTADEQIGDEGFGKFVQSAGAHDVTHDVLIGQQDFGIGEYELSGDEFTLFSIGGALVLGDSAATTQGTLTQTGGVLTTRDTIVGNEGTGVVAHEGGKHRVGPAVGGQLVLGAAASGDGTYTLGGTGDLVADFEIVGGLGTGLVRQSAGSNAALFDLTLGDTATGMGTYELSGTGGLIAGREIIGRDGKGLFKQSGGENRYSESLVLGQNLNSSGRYELSAGTLGVIPLPPEETIGHAGLGEFVQSGGTHIAAATLYIGRDASGVGTYELNDGALNAVTEFLGFAGEGTFTQQAGTHRASNALHIGSQVGGVGTYNLDGGSLDTGNELIGTHGEGTFNQSLGDHKVTFKLVLADEHDGHGVYDLADGTLSAVNLIVANRGMAEFFQRGGDVSLRSNLTIANATTGATGVYELRDGTLAAQDQFIGVHGTAGFIQSAGANTVSGTLLLGELLDGNGTYTLEAGDLLALNETIGNQGAGKFVQTGGRNIVAEELVLSRALGGRGTYTLDDGELRANNEFIAHSGEGLFVQNGGMHTVDDTLSIKRDRAIIGRYELNAGTLTAMNIVNDGEFAYAGGDLAVGGADGTGKLTNNGDLALSGPGVRAVQGDVTNNGTLKTTDTTAMFSGNFINNGAYNSDPSDNFFVDLIVSSGGFLTGGLGDNFYIAGSFANHSTQNTSWDTAAATLGFGYDVTGALTGLSLDFFLAGADSGVDGFTDNFAWGTLDLAAGNTVRLFDGNTANAGTAFYVDTLLGADLFGDTVANIIGGASGRNIYYRAGALGNAYLGGWNYRLSGGGLLIAAGGRGALFPVPEPATALLLAVGVAGLCLRRRRTVC